MNRNRTAKWIALLLAAAMLAGLCAFTASADYDTTGATAFVFSDGGIAVAEGDYDGYKVEGTALTINGAGTYVVSGSCADGSIKVKKGTTGVTLVLDGLSLTSSDTAPIACNKSTEVTIVAAAGSVNTLTDSAYNNDETYPDNENAENAVIKTKDGSRVTLCGTGTINVIANGKNGVKGGATTEEEGEASLTVKELTLNVTCGVNDGIKSDQELNLLSGSITVSAADDGIKSDYVLNIGAAGTAGPTIVVSKSNEGIEAATLNIYSGSITVHAADDGINAANSDLTDYSFSCNIYGGTVYVDAQSGDGIDSNGSLTISGGTVEVYSASSGDNSPLDAETSVSLTGGTLLAVGAPGMGVSFTQGSQTSVIFGSSAMGGGMGGQMPGMAGNQGGFGPGSGGQMPGMSGEGGVSVSAGSTVAILDSNGNTVYSATAVRAASTVIFSSADLTAGETYTLYVNGSAAATAIASTGTGMGGQPGDGTQPGAEMPGMPGDGTQPGQPGDGQQPGMPGDGTQPGMPGEMPAGMYSDLQPGAWYYDAALWADASDVMDAESESSFGVSSACSRAETVLALWKAVGSPEPTAAANPFADVAESAEYYKAVLWAVENGVTNGVDANHFDPDGTVTRAQAVTFLYRARKASAVGAANPFSDVQAGSWYYDAVLWAVENGVTNGVDAAHFDPAATLTRGHVVTFLYRLYGSQV